MVIKMRSVMTGKQTAWNVFECVNKLTLNKTDPMVWGYIEEEWNAKEEDTEEAQTNTEG